MDTFELTKIAGAVLCALLVIVGFHTALEIAGEGRAPQKPGYTLPMPAVKAPSDIPAGGAAAVPSPVDLPAVPPPTFDAAAVAEAAATASPEAGAKVFGKCHSCHSAEKDKPSPVGPNLWGVVGRPKGSLPGFNYSDAMKAKGGDWTLADLAGFVHKPKEYVPGTKMSFPGVADPSDLADLLAYLGTLKQ